MALWGRAGAAGMVALAAAIVWAGAGAGPAGASGPTLLGTGSSYAALAINQWVAELSTEGTNINYSTQSSVLGLNYFATGQVDFGASEIGYSSGQANNTPPAGYQYQYMPDIAGATCLDYNLSNQLGQKITALKLNASVMTGIFTGTITTWNNAAIAALNPGVLLPSSAIVVVYRTDASGDNYIFSDYLDTLEPTAWNAFASALSSPTGPQAIWPTPPGGQRTVGSYNFGNWTGESGSDNASNYVYGNPNTITYVETGYALLHSDPCAQVENGAGAFVAPSETTDAVALQNDALEPDLEQNLVPVFNSPQAGAYPISAYSYLIMGDQSEVSAAKQPVEAAFIQFLACRGQQAAGALGYSPLPPNLVQADFDAVQRITGTALPAPTAANCPDPYITGSFNAAPPPTIGGTSSTPAAGSAGGGAVTSPVAGAASSAAASASASGGGTGSKASGSSASGGAGGTSASGGSSASQAAAAAASTTTTTDAAAPPPGQIPGLALKDASDQLLAVPGPSAWALVGVLGLLVILITPPMIALALRRRRTGDAGTVLDDAGPGPQ